MPGIALTPKQEEKKREIIRLLDCLIHWKALPSEELENALDKLSQTCFGLHEELAAEGQVPTYRAEVMAKRGMAPKTAEFYRNMYGAEALLDFLENGPPKKG